MSPHIAFGAYAALRECCEGGDGRVAPAELLAHDGSTEGQPQASTAAFWLGRWPNGAFPSGAGQPHSPTS